MGRQGFKALAASAVLLSLIASAAGAFDKGGCGSGDCVGCHTLTRDEASKILSGLVDNVLNVELSPVGGLWVVDILKSGRKFPIYMDFSKNFLISGQVVKLSTKEDITGARFEQLNAVTADVSSIPVGDAIVVGKPTARHRVIVFSDPDCHVCGKFHEELKAAAARDPNVAFFIKMYSRNNDPAVNAKARAIHCSKSPSMLEDAYAGKTIPPPSCKEDSTGETYRLAEKLNIMGTPAFVLPDGRVVGGFRTADVLLKLAVESKPQSGDAKKPGTKESGKKK